MSSPLRNEATTEGDVLSHLRTVRDLINKPRRQTQLLVDAASWNMLCSCLDTIGDSQFAIEAYSEVSVDKIGARYLHTYGLLQALYVQQDAVANLATALNIPYSRPATLTSIREARNETAGHPTSRHGRTFHFLSQISLTAEGYTMMTTYADGRPPTFHDVRLNDLVIQQDSCLVAVLHDFAVLLREEDQRHREEFRSMSLADLFPDIISYYFEKVYAGIERKDHRAHGAGMIKLLLGIVSGFESELVRRSILDAYEGITQELEELQWALQELGRYLSGDQSCNLNERSARIYAFYCREAVRRLEESASDLDREYNEADDRD